MKFTSYWLDTAPATPDRSRTEVGGEVDVAVVGGGLTGMSAALHLARKGARVAVLEKETVGWGASGRNGGMATPGLSLGLRDAIKRYGFPTARDLYNSYYDAIDTIEKVVAEEGIDCDFARNGKLNLAAKPAHFDGHEAHLRGPDRAHGRRHDAGAPQRAAARRSARRPTTAPSSIPSAPGCTWASSCEGWGRAPPVRVPRSTRRPAWRRSTDWGAPGTTS